MLIKSVGHIIINACFVRINACMVIYFVLHARRGKRSKAKKRNIKRKNKLIKTPNRESGVLFLEGSHKWIVLKHMI